ncbi:MAG TPA: phage holin family protein [Steroidobacteraceae bacterium]|jgi:uncharacterized membrane protein YqjE|nr:phage holin family protein [Steroidobacteraceae bacterium]
MPAVERSFSDVLQDIVHNLQDIIRAEVRLAKTEVREELTKVRAATLLVGVGAVSGVFGVLFLLLATLYGLTNIVPDWAAALILAIALSLCAGIAVSKGVKQFKQVTAAPKTTESLKENIEWAKQQIK